MFGETGIQCVVTSVERRAHNADVQDDGACCTRTKLTVRLQHGSNQGNQAHERHVWQHDHE